MRQNFSLGGSLNTGWNTLRRVDVERWMLVDSWLILNRKFVEKKKTIVENISNMVWTMNNNDGLMCLLLKWSFEWLKLKKPLLNNQKETFEAEE